MLIAHKYIVFCEEHYNPLGVIRSLGEQGVFPVLIVVRDKKGRQIASKSKYISKIYKVNSIDDGYSILTTYYSAKGQKIFVITSDDKITSHLDEHYDELRKDFIFFNAGKKGRITQFMNKDTLSKLAIKYGLNVPKSYVVNKGEIPENIQYPVITKSISSTIGGWKKDVYICYSESDLKNAYSHIKSNIVLIQKFIEKKNELSLDGFTVDKGNKMLITVAANYNYTVPGEYSRYMTLKNFDDDKLQRALSGMFSEIGFEGIFSVDFLIDNEGELYFLEINFRNSAWSYASTCLDMNLPILWSNAMIRGEIEHDTKRIVPNGYTAMVEFTDFKIRVIGEKMSLKKWLRDVRNCGCLFYFNKNDMKPFWSALFYRIRFKIVEKLSK